MCATHTAELSLEMYSMQHAQDHSIMGTHPKGNSILHLWLVSLWILREINGFLTNQGIIGMPNPPVSRPAPELFLVQAWSSNQTSFNWHIGNRPKRSFD